MFTFLFTIMALFVLLGGIALALVGKDKDGDFEFNIRPLRGLPFVLAAVALFTTGLGFTSVNKGTIGVVLRFGRPVKQLDPGLHFVRPYADSVTEVNVQKHVVKPSEDASSLDLQVVHTEVTFAYHVDPAYATYTLVQNADDVENRVVNPAILEAIKATTAKYNAQELIANRAQVRDGIETMVNARIAPEHLIAESTSITGFSFSNDYEQAIEAKVTAQQKSEKAENDLKRIQIEAEQQVAQAKGEAEALKVQKEQITPQLLQLRTIEMMREKWDGQLPNVMIGGGGTLPMMDVLKAAQAGAGNNGSTTRHNGSEQNPSR